MTITIKGKSGKMYIYEEYNLKFNFRERTQANYIYAKKFLKNGNYVYTIVYIGITDDLKRRMIEHEKEWCLRNYGANCILMHTNNSEIDRKFEESDLLSNHNTSCNKLENN